MACIEPQCLYKSALYLALLTVLSNPLLHLTNSRDVALHYTIPDQCKLHTVNPNAFQQLLFQPIAFFPLRKTGVIIFFLATD